MLKKTILLTVIVLFSPLACFALEKFDQTSCSSSNNEMGACIQNKTGVEIGSPNLVLMMKLTFLNSNQQATGLPIIRQFAPDHYIDIFWTSEIFKKTHLAKIDYSLVQDYSLQQTSPTQSKIGEAYGRVVPGCDFTIPNSSPKMMLGIYKDNNGLLTCKSL